MKTHTPRLLALVLALMQSLPASVAEAGKSGKTKERLATGEVIVTTKQVAGSTVAAVTAMAVINATPARVWAVVENCNDYSKTMIRTLESKELWRKGNKVRCKVTIDMPFPLSDLTATTDAIHTVKAGKKYKRAWSLVTGDYAHNSGSWTLVPFDDTGKTTLAIYKVHAVPNVPIPEGIQRAAQRKSLPNLMENLRKQVGAGK